MTLVIATKEDSNCYTINPFITYLQETGYYEVINDVKCKITTDVAIEVCEILTESPHCEEVVRIYMTCPSRPRPSPARRRSSPTSRPSRADILISILDAHNIPHDKFKKLILKVEVRRKRDDLEIKHQIPIDIIERNDYPLEISENNKILNNKK